MWFWDIHVSKHTVMCRWIQTEEVCSNYRLNFKDIFTTFRMFSLESKSVQYAVKAQTSLAPLSWFHGSCVTTAHAHQCCIFQSYAKTVPSRMKSTMCEPASMTTDTWSRHMTSDFNSVFEWSFEWSFKLHNFFYYLNYVFCSRVKTILD